MKVDRTWEMPNKWTFKMKCVQELLQWHDVGKGWADPFSGFYSPAEFTNDIEGDRPVRHTGDGLLFLKEFNNNHLKGVLFDPPYSEEQCLRLYTPKHNGRTGRAEYLAKCRDEVGRIIAIGGLAISFGWDSCGIGKKRGLEIEEILLICHGANHNDTIVTVERKLQ